MRRKYRIPAAIALYLCGFLLLPSAVSSAGLAMSGSQRTDLLLGNRRLYEDKVYGAWYGKLIGLALGQPVEGWPKQYIAEKANQVGAYPVRYYFPSNFDSPMKGFLLGNFTASPPNDDSDLMLTSLLALREHGVKLTSRDIAETWVKYVPGACTAEAVGLENFRKGVWPPRSAEIDNPYGEWIGAQMRADIWGMLAPGRPELAARYARLDARITHTGNGIYAAQYISALISLAMVERDPEQVVREALAVIPKDCVYAGAIRDVLKWHSENRNWEDAWDLIDAKYGMFSDGSRFRDFPEAKYKTGFYKNWNDMRWVYADVNGAAVALALIYGEGDFSRSICIATMCGYDNDCNSGTVGAVLGAMRGERAIPTRWKKPMGDTYISGLKLADRELKISKLADETVGYGLQVAAREQ